MATTTKKIILLAFPDDALESVQTIFPVCSYVEFAASSLLLWHCHNYISSYIQHPVMSRNWPISSLKSDTCSSLIIRSLLHPNSAEFGGFLHSVKPKSAEWKWSITWCTCTNLKFQHLLCCSFTPLTLRPR